MFKLYSVAILDHVWKNPKVLEYSVLALNFEQALIRAIEKANQEDNFAEEYIVSIRIKDIKENLGYFEYYLNAGRMENLLIEKQGNNSKLVDFSEYDYFMQLTNNARR